MLGGGTSGAVAVLAIALEIPVVDIIAGIGVVVGAALGAWYAPMAATTNEPIGLVFRMSILAMPIGGAIFGVIFAGGTAPALILLTTAFAVVLYPLLAPVILPIALAAVLAGRRLVTLPRRTSGLLLAILLAADIAGAIVAPGIADRLSPTLTNASGDIFRTGPHWFLRLTAARRVEVTVVNRSTDPAYVELSWPIGGGFEGGTEEFAPGCYVLAATMLAEDGWELRVRTPRGADGDPGMLIAEADDAPGDISLVVEVDRDGTVRRWPGRLADSELGPIPGCGPGG
jgi:hypothetical protein